jgi:hypothetical protein
MPAHGQLQTSQEPSSVQPPSPSEQPCGQSDALSHDWKPPQLTSQLQAWSQRTPSAQVYELVHSTLHGPSPHSIAPLQASTPTQLTAQALAWLQRSPLLQLSVPAQSRVQSPLPQTIVSSQLDGPLQAMSQEVACRQSTPLAQAHGPLQTTWQGIPAGQTTVWSQL